MKAYESLTRIGLVAALLVPGLLIAEAVAQPLPDPAVRTESLLVVRDTITTEQEAVLIDLLDTNLRALADRDRLGRRIGGYVMLGLGIGSVVGGGVTLVVGEGDDARIVGYSLIGGGVLLSGLSAIPFSVRSEPERLYAEFGHLPADAPGQIRSKYYYGDRRFEELARERRRDRIIGGVITIVGAGATSLLLVGESGPERLHAFVWPALGGVASILIKSEVERRHESYSRAKDDILGRTAGAEVIVGLVPLPNGRIGGVLQVRL